MNRKLLYWATSVAAAAALGGCQRQSTTGDPPASLKPAPAPVPPVAVLPVPGPAGAPPPARAASAGRQR